MSEFRVRKSDMRKFIVFPNTIKMFDEYVLKQNLGQEDIVFPDGWTELNSIDLYKNQPELHLWMQYWGIIPQDKVAAAFPQRLRGQELLDYNLEKLPSEMTRKDFKKLIGGK